MSGRKNNLIVIENGQIKIYNLDDKLKWKVGRPSTDNIPDIKLYSNTVSRNHGEFVNMDGIWFYLDGKNKNGTVFNKKKIGTGLNGKAKPVMLSDGDVLIFGGGEKAVINSVTIWTMFTNTNFDSISYVSNTNGYEEIKFKDGCKEIRYHKPEKGTVVKMDNGLAIYMGENTYVLGNIEVTGK